MTTVAKKPKHGGSRPGSGRKKTGNSSWHVWVNEAELIHLKEKMGDKELKWRLRAWLRALAKKHGFNPDGK